MTLLLRCLAMTFGLSLLSGCTDDREPGDHVWKQQTDTIQRAENVNQLLKEADDERRRSIDQQSE
jgi:hypothetical protein